jgi:hypothetical protein
VTSGEADCISSLGSGDINSRRISSAPSKSSRGRVPMRRDGGETEASMALMLCVAVTLSSPENESARGAPNRRRVGEEGAAGVHWLVDELSSMLPFFALRLMRRFHSALVTTRQQRAPLLRST